MIALPRSTMFCMCCSTTATWNPRTADYRFVSGLLEDWWRGRYAQRFAPVFDRQR